MQYLKLFLIFGPASKQGQNKVKVIKKYLNTEHRSVDQIDETLLSLLCLPEIKWSSQQLEPKFHTFIVTREDGQRLYGAGLTVWEQPANIICHTQIGHNPIAEDDRSDDDAFVDQLPSSASIALDERKFASFCYCILTTTPFINATQSLLNLIWEENCDDAIVRCIMHIRLPLPRRCLRICLPRKSSSTPVNYGHNSNNMLTFYNQSSESLTKSTRKAKPNDSFPSTNKSSRRRDDVYIYRGPTDLPLFDYPLRELFTIVPVDDFLFAFACILMELRTLIIGTDNYQLTMIGEALTSLLLPLKWCHVYVPILPPISGANYIDAPLPYIMGINEELTKLPTHLNYVQCCIYCDQGRVECNVNSLTLPPFFDDLREEIVQIFSKYDIKYERNSKNNKSTTNMEMDESNELPEYNMEEGQPSISRRHSSSAILNKSLQTLRDVPVSAILSSHDTKGRSRTRQFTYLDDLKFNQAIRVAFMRSIRRNILTNYDRFISTPLVNGDQHQFDAVSYLCDQPEFMRGFLKGFLETQMFASFIDESAKRIQKYRNSSQSSLRIHDNDPEEFAIQFNDKQLEEAFKDAERVKLLDLKQEKEHGLEVKAVPASPLKLRRRAPQVSLLGGHKSLDISVAAVNLPRFMVPSPGTPNSTPLSGVNSSSLATPPTPRTSQQMRLVERLIKEVRNITKRIIIEKIGLDEPTDSIGNLSTKKSSAFNVKSDNALICSLCDVIERIWSHGTFLEPSDANSQCPLWTHLVAFARLKFLDSRPPQSEFSDGSNLDVLNPTTFDSRNELNKLIWNSVNGGLADVQSFNKSGHPAAMIDMFSSSLIHDLHTIQSLNDVKTEVGKSRAFIRLALERKVLSQHLRTLLSDQTLLESNFRQYAFLRCEEEREQFLTHLLTLNAVDLSCFTNTFTTNTSLHYAPNETSVLQKFKAWVLKKK